VKKNIIAQSFHRHQVKVLGMDDPSDVSLVNMFEGDQFQLGGNESQIFQEAEDITQKSRTLYHGSKRYLAEVVEFFSFEFNIKLILIF